MAAVSGFSYHANVLEPALAQRLAAGAAKLLAPSAGVVEDRQSTLVHFYEFDANHLELVRECARQGLLTGPIDWLQCLSYPDGVGFTAHLDSAHRWGPRIVAASIGAPTELLLQRAGHATVRQVLEPLSAYVLTEAARYVWKHGISRRLRGGARVSFVLRTSRLFARAAFNLGVGPDWNEEEAKLYITDHDGKRLSKLAVDAGTAAAAVVVVDASGWR